MSHLLGLTFLLETGGGSRFFSLLVFLFFFCLGFLAQAMVMPEDLVKQVPGLQMAQAKRASD